jgi:hypothetical protein
VAARQQVAAILDQLEKSGDFAKAHEDLSALFDQAIGYSLAKDVDLIRDIDFALRMVGQLEKAPDSRRVELLKFLRANDNAARALVFLIHPRQDPKTIYELFDRLREKRGKELDKFATLTAAISVVHDRPLKQRVNENTAEAPDPIAIFDYYRQNEARMYFGIRAVPAELLIFVVDTKAQIREMEWALEKYARDDKVGARFFDIKYDYTHVRNGTPKQVTLSGFNLPNIHRLGGICADQAYFAAGVGKAIGVPAVYTWGASGEVAHAWVGFLEATAQRGWWNFDIGRYEAYKGVRGIVFDPQLRENIPDSFVSLLAEMIGTKPGDRHNAVALADAVVRLMKEGKAFNPVAPNGVNGTLAKPRKADLNAQLELLELAVRANPADRNCWLPIAELAKNGKLSLDLKKKWAGVIERLCGQKYPDFALALLAPMVMTVEDPREQNNLWNSAFAMFQNRMDLAAAVRMQQAAMWEKHNDVDKAGQCYEDVIQRYANAGPFVIEALKKAEKALRDSKRSREIPVLYEQTWLKTERPKERAAPYASQSNWFRIGEMFATKLEEAGEAQKADAVREMLGSVAPVARERRP